MPVFQRIHHVVVKDGKLLLVTFALQTICLEEHFNAFKVVCTKVGPRVVDVRELLCHKAFDIQTSERKLLKMVTKNSSNKCNKS